MTDTQGASVSGATVKLKDKATNQERATVTSGDGLYTFPNIEPGIYDLTVSIAQFKTTTIPGMKVEVTKAITQDVKLEVGQLSEQITVSSTADTQLQKNDASLGNSFDERYKELPIYGRGIAQGVLSLQPGTTPTGEVTGSRADQSTFALEGVDVSDNNLGQAFRTVIPTPAEAIQEFRVTVANPNATFGRSAGGQVTLVSRRGGQSFHGSLYEYHRNSALNANRWDNNRTGVPRPSFIDNTFGGSIGGPIIKDKTFFFFLYEGQRFPSQSTATRIVPTSTLKQGLLRFRDAAVVVQTIDPAVPDPRDIGASPTILSLLNQYPEPNDFSQGDGLNTAGFTANYPVSLRGDQGWARIDHSFNQNWNFDGTFTAFRQLQTQNTQVDIVNRQALTNSPSRPRFVSSALTGVITPHLTNEFRFGWTADRNGNIRTSAGPQLPGVNIALDLAGTPPGVNGFLDEPIDVDTQRARTQLNTLNVYQFIDNATWVKGNHTFQPGFNIRHLTFFHQRDDKVVGSLSAPLAQLGSATFNQIPAAERPAFIQAADVARYNQLYASLLGEVETVGYLLSRDAQLNPLAIGAPLVTSSSFNAYEMYFSDTWRVTPSLTLSYGLLYGWQTPPSERDGKQIVAVFRDTSELVNPQKYLQDKLAAANQGQFFNPEIAFLPLANSNTDRVFNLDRKNFSPRIAAAWNPSYQSGMLGKLFGDRRTVLRGGYSLLYDRNNAVQTVTVPTLGVGFAQTLSSNSLRNGAGQPFRVGADGTVIPLATPVGATPPILPSTGFGETLSFVVDPFITVPRNHTISFHFQRLLPGNMTVEVGYIGRLGRNLYQSLNLNQVPYMFKDPASGQTFAQAFDAVAGQLRGGTAAASVTPQPFFENMLVNLRTTANVPVPAGQRTAQLAQRQSANLINGNLSNLFLGFLDNAAAQTFNNNRVQELFFRTSAGRSNYHAMAVTLRKRFSSGLTFDMNYTYSKSLDQNGAVQNTANIQPNSFFLDAEYSRSPFDIEHLFNANGVYELPFGRGRRWASSASGLFGKVISGWYTSGIFRAGSGFPLAIVQGTQVWGGSSALGFGGTTNASGAIILPGADATTGLNSGVVGSGGVGTSGNPATRGSGLNIFANPEALFRNVRRVQLSDDTRSGRGALSGFGFWQADMTAGKRIAITERVNFKFSVDFINVFNHVNFADPSTSLQNPAVFGVVTTQRFSENVQGLVPRRIQFGGRIEF
ncbi:MAG: carboxypeptidase-like regulatory domain-containing protein [Acidobacteria bacterium]|nr:carboxypeptidase-like regulatory domain-containing protein [Acidobacteriota bacterium]